MSNERNPSKDKQQNDRQNLPKDDQNKQGNRNSQGQGQAQNQNRDNKDRQDR